MKNKIVLLAFIFLLFVCFLAGRCSKRCPVIETQTRIDTVTVIRPGAFEIKYAELIQRYDSLKQAKTNILIKYKYATDSVFITDTVFENQYLKFYNDTIQNDDGQFFIETGVLGDLLSVGLNYKLNHQTITKTVTEIKTEKYKGIFLAAGYDVINSNFLFGAGYKISNRWGLQGLIGKETLILNGTFDLKK